MIKRAGKFYWEDFREQVLSVCFCQAYGGSIILFLVREVRKDFPRMGAGNFSICLILILKLSGFHAFGVLPVLKISTGILSFFMSQILVGR
ncbi:MAG: hypothetical protein FWF54_05840 [Candidatus Azobacteroides sp.]|nr:hypothetical protein [Candidatus Azobacteroides sp.]